MPCFSKANDTVAELHVTLWPCGVQRVEQHWTFHGPNAPGNNNEGLLMFGDYANILAIPK